MSVLALNWRLRPRSSPSIEQCAVRQKQTSKCCKNQKRGKITIISSRGYDINKKYEIAQMQMIIRVQQCS